MTQTNYPNIIQLFIKFKDVKIQLTFNELFLISLGNNLFKHLIILDLSKYLASNDNLIKNMLTNRGR